MGADENPNDGLAVDGIALRDIGQTLMELGRQLSEVGKISEQPDDDATLQAVFGDQLDENSPEAFRAEMVRERAASDAMTRTLMGLQSFRRGYEHWERLTAEYAMTKQGFTQRRTASLLGVAVSTVNRWSQHPLTDDDAS